MLQGQGDMAAFQMVAVAVTIYWRRMVDSSQGVVDGDVRETCTACATTLMLEMGYLSVLTGAPPRPGVLFPALEWT